MWNSPPNQILISVSLGITSFQTTTKHKPAPISSFSLFFLLLHPFSLLLLLSSFRINTIDGPVLARPTFKLAQRPPDILVGSRWSSVLSPACVSGPRSLLPPLHLPSSSDINKGRRTPINCLSTSRPPPQQFAASSQPPPWTRQVHSLRRAARRPHHRSPTYPRRPRSRARRCYRSITPSATRHHPCPCRPTRLARSPR